MPTQMSPTRRLMKYIKPHLTFLPVGETERTLSARFNEHTSTATNAQGHYKSAMLQHARENNHHFRREDATVFAYEHDWAKRGIYEALFIKALAQQPQSTPQQPQ